MSRDLVVPSLLGWMYYLDKGGERILIEAVVKAWIAGLREAGVKARNAKVWSRGVKSYPVDLPFVVEFACPYGHRTADRRQLAAIRVIVEDDAWITFDEESTCSECDLSSVERWLLTCPRCERGEQSIWHPASPHAHSHRRGELANGEAGVLGSTSPLSFVLMEFERLGRLAEALWWTDHTVAAIEDFRGQESGTYPPDVIEHRIAANIKHAQRVIAQASARTGAALPHSRPSWSDESAAQWLDQQKTADGEARVLPSASQRDAWAISESLAGHPPKNVVERAQTLRKRRLRL